MKKKNITTSIGIINLNDIVFCEDTLDVFIGIESVSADIQDKINKAVEVAKAEHLQRIKEYFINKNRNWTDAGVETNLSLHIIIDNKEFTYRIEIDIEDKADSTMWTGVSVNVDLSEY